jgi:hypothetical protein
MYGKNSRLLEEEEEEAIVCKLMVPCVCVVCMPACACAGGAALA